jgi:hypothetical protein
MVKIIYLDDSIESIPCSYISWGGIFGTRENEKLQIHGRNGCPFVSINVNSFKRMDFTDLPTEKETTES